VLKGVIGSSIYRADSRLCLAAWCLGRVDVRRCRENMGNFSHLIEKHGENIRENMFN
jgi:hypothetical protein